MLQKRYTVHYRLRLYRSRSETRYLYGYGDFPFCSESSRAAPVAQTSEPRAGFRMGQSTYRTDAVAEAQAASRDEVVVTSVLLPS